MIDQPPSQSIDLPGYIVLDSSMFNPNLGLPENVSPNQLEKSELSKRKEIMDKNNHEEIKIGIGAITKGIQETNRNTISIIEAIKNGKTSFTGVFRDFSTNLGNLKDTLKNSINKSVSGMKSSVSSMAAALDPRPLIRGFVQSMTQSVQNIATAPLKWIGGFFGKNKAAKEQIEVLNQINGKIESLKNTIDKELKVLSQIALLQHEQAVLDTTPQLQLYDQLNSFNEQLVQLNQSVTSGFDLLAVTSRLQYNETQSFSNDLFTLLRSIYAELNVLPLEFESSTQKASLIPLEQIITRIDIFEKFNQEVKDIQSSLTKTITEYLPRIDDQSNILSSPAIESFLGRLLEGIVGGLSSFIDDDTEKVLSTTNIKEAELEDRIFKERQQNQLIITLNGIRDEIRSLRKSSTTFGNSQKGILDKIKDGIVDFASIKTKLGSFMKIAGRVGLGIGGAAAGVSGIMGIASGQDSLGNWASAIGGGAALGASLGSLTGPVGTAIGAGVGALVGAIAGLIAKYKDEILEWITNIFEPIKEKFIQIKTYIVESFGKIADAFKQDGIIGGLFTLYDQFVIKPIVGIFDDAKLKIIDFSKTFAADFMNLFDTIRNNVAQFSAPIVETIAGVFEKIRNTITTSVTTLIEGFEQEGIFGGMKSIYQVIFKPIITSLLELVRDVTPDWVQGLFNVVNGIITAIKNKISSLFDGMKEDYEEGGILGAFFGIFDRVFGGLFDAVTEKTSQWTKEFLAPFQEGLDAFNEEIKKLWSRIKDKAFDLLPDFAKKALSSEPKTNTNDDIISQQIMDDLKNSGKIEEKRDGFLGRRTKLQLSSPDALKKYTTQQLEALVNSNIADETIRQSAIEELANRTDEQPSKQSKASRKYELSPVKPFTLEPAVFEKLLGTDTSQMSNDGSIQAGKPRLTINNTGENSDIVPYTYEQIAMNNKDLLQETVNMIANKEAQSVLQTQVAATALYGGGSGSLSSQATNIVTVNAPQTSIQTHRGTPLYSGTKSSVAMNN